MAFFHKRGDRIEIRESVATARGPRSRVLESFAGALTPDVLARAARKASRPFDPWALRQRALATGIETHPVAREPEARALLARLRRGDPMDPCVVTLLRQALEGAEAAPLPDSAADVAEWIGADDRDRGVALHDLLGLAERILQSTPERRLPPRPDFPPFASRAA